MARQAQETSDRRELFHSLRTTIESDDAKLRAGKMDLDTYIALQGSHKTKRQTISGEQDEDRMDITLTIHRERQELAREVLELQRDAIGKGYSVGGIRKPKLVETGSSKRKEE